MDPAIRQFVRALAGQPSRQDYSLPPVLCIAAALLQLQDFEPTFLSTGSTVIFQRWKYRTKLEARLVVLCYGGKSHSPSQLQELEEGWQRQLEQTDAHLHSQMFIFLDAGECWLWPDIRTKTFSKFFFETLVLQALHRTVSRGRTAFEDRSFRLAFFQNLFSKGLSEDWRVERRGLERLSRMLIKKADGLGKALLQRVGEQLLRNSSVSLHLETVVISGKVTHGLRIQGARRQTLLRFEPCESTPTAREDYEHQANRFVNQLIFLVDIHTSEAGQDSYTAEARARQLCEFWGSECD